MSSWDFAIKVLEMMKEPALIGALITVAGQFWLILKLVKRLKESEEARMAERKEYYTCIDQSMKETALTLKGLVTLIEILVYGRNRNGNP